jgi:uncharacterized protein (DUF1330 family)
MAAFILADTKILNAENYEEYKALAKPIAEKYGGVYRARGQGHEVSEGQLWEPSRLVIIEFPDMDAARAFVNSEEYAPVKKIRQANADCNIILVEGM